MRTLVNIRSSSWLLLLAGLCVSFVLSVGLPLSWGQQYGLLENVQAATLLLGMLVALMAARQQRGMAASKIWWVASLCWLSVLGQELAWDALSVASASAGAGNAIGSWGLLWWKPAMMGLCLGMLLACLYWVVRHRLISRVVLRWLREGAIPWGCLLVAGLAMLLSVLAQDHGSAWTHKLPDATLAIMGEVAQCWAYAALWWAQWVLLHHMQDWRSSSYLQTMHFSLTKGLERRAI